jgi:hypothetical protein
MIERENQVLAPFPQDPNRAGDLFRQLLVRLDDLIDHGRGRHESVVPGS